MQARPVEIARSLGLIGGASDNTREAPATSVEGNGPRAFGVSGPWT
jgi:hypothetical protein